MDGELGREEGVRARRSYFWHEKGEVEIGEKMREGGREGGNRREGGVVCIGRVGKGKGVAGGAGRGNGRGSGAGFEDGWVVGIFAFERYNISFVLFLDRY